MMKSLLRGISIGIVAIIVLALFDHRVLKSDSRDAASGDLATTQAFSKFFDDAAPPLPFETAPLERTIDHIEFNNATAREAIEQLAGKLNAILNADWPAIEAASDKTDRRVTLSLQHVSGEGAMQLLLHAAGIDASKIEFTENEEGQLVVGDATKLDAVVRTRIYDIRGLIALLTTIDRNDPRPAIEQITSSGEAVDCIIKLIQDSVLSESWRDNGGTTGSIREFSGMLVISHNEVAHRQIAVLLDRLRKMPRFVLSSTRP
jgi:hypothetical protein